MFEEADRDSDQLINFNEFFRVMRKREDPLDDWSSDEDEAYWSKIIDVESNEV